MAKWHLKQAIIAAALLLLSCSRFDKDANCLNDKSACFKADKTAPTFVSSTPAPAAVVSRLSQLTVVFSEELKDPQPQDVVISGGGKGQLTLTSITKTAANTYSLVFSPDTVATGAILIDFTNLTDYNNNKLNYSLALTGNVDIEIAFDINTATNPAYRKGVSNGGGYTTTDIKWRHEYVTDPNNNWDMRVTTGAVDCNAGTSVFTGTGLPHATDVTRTLDRVTHFTSGARTYRVVVCITNAAMNKKGTGSVEIIRDDTPPTATHLPVSDDYNSTKSMTVACSDNADKVAVHAGQLSPWDGNLANPANPADPDFDASGNVSVGALLSGSYAITNPTNPTRTKVRYRCIDIAGNKSAVSPATYLVDTMLPEVTLNLDTSFRQFISVTGYTTTTVNFTTNQSGTQYRIVKNATSCAALDGTSVIGAGPFTTPPAGPHVINASALDVGVNNLRVCVSNVGATKWAAASLQITRDDTVPIITPSVTTGTYGAVQVVNLTCAPNPEKVAITDAVLAGSTAPTPPPDPNIDANGIILFGKQQDQFTTPDASVSTIKWQCISKSGNRSLVDGTTTATYTVDAILPTVTIVNNTRNFVSNLVAAYNFTDLTFQVSRPGLTYSIKSGSTNCLGGTTLATGTVVTAGQNITERLNAPLAGPPTHFSAVGSYDLKICVPNFIGALGYSTTSLIVQREDSRPNDVTGLSVTAATTTSVTLGWTVPADVGPAGIAGYRILQTTTPGDYSSPTVYTSATNSVNISGLAPSTTYYFVVKAIDNAGNVSSGNSNEVVSRFALSVTVTGYASAANGPFSVQLGSGQTLSFTADGTQTFTQVFLPNDAYSLSTTAQPATQNCAFVANQYGTMTASVNLQVSCVNGYLQSGALTANPPAVFGQMLYRGNATLIAGGGSGSICTGANNANCYNGTGTNARFNNPHGITMVSGRIYIADRENNRIREYNVATNMTSTFAGEGSGATTDGVGTGARINKPQAITSDGVNLYVAESLTPPDSAYIRRINLATQQVTTIAGGGNGTDGSACPGADQADCRDGAAHQARFGAPNDIKYHAGHLYISEYGNKRVRRLSLATGQVTTIAGNGMATSVDNSTGTAASFNGATGIALIGNFLYVVDYGGHSIRSVSLTSPHAVTTIAGSGTSGHVDGPATAARFTNPDHIFADGRDLYITEYGGRRLRRINLLKNSVSTIAGSEVAADTAGIGAAAELNGPVGIVSDGRRLFVVTYDGGRLFRITDSGLVGYWPLTNATDLRDYNSDLVTLNNGSWVSGSSAFGIDRFGGATGMQFNNSNTQISASTPLNAGSACNVSMTAWLRTPTPASGTTKAVVYNGNSGGSGFGFMISPAGELVLMFGGVGAIGSVPTLPANQWIHAATVCRPGNIWRLYINGHLVVEGDGTASQRPNANPPLSLLIGRGSGGASEHFDGTISEVRLYNRALSEGEINELAQDAAQAQVGASYNTAATGLLSHYEFSSGAATTPTGPVGGVLVPSGAPAQVPGKDGDANGASQYIGAPDKYTGSETGLPMSNHPRTACAWVKPAYYPTSGGFFSILSYGNPASAQMFSLVIREVSGAQHVSMLSFGAFLTRPVALPLQTWSHVCGTHNGTGGSIYVNGALQGAADQALTIATAATNGLIIGSSSSLGTSHFPGAIDDVRIYNNVLTQLQIRQLATQVPAGLVARYDFTGDRDDTSGFGQHLSNNGGTLDADRFGNANASALFTANAYMEVTATALPLGNRSRTLCAWTKPTNLLNGTFSEVAMYGTSGGPGWGIGMDASGGLPNGRIFTLNSATDLIYNRPHGLNIWRHVCATYNGADEVLYLDAYPVANQGIPTINTAGSQLFIGKGVFTGDFFNGNIDDVRIYNRALSLAEIQALQQQPNKKVQLSGSAVQGDMGGSPAGIVGADQRCPLNFKAMIVDGTARRACSTASCSAGITEHIDWVLRPNITYLRGDGVTLITTSDFAGVLPFPFTAAITGIGDQAWTGLNTDWTTSTHTCNSWTTTSNQGQFALGNILNAGSIASAIQGCALTAHLYCVEQ